MATLPAMRRHPSDGVTSSRQGVSGSAPLRIYLQNTSDTTYSKGLSFSAAIVGMTKVHDATTLLPGVVGSFDIALMGGAPFTYTGGGLYVAYEWGPYGGTLSTADQIIWCNSTGLIGGLMGNNTGVDALLASNFRPETRLTSNVQNDIAAGPVYSLGELPLGIVPAQTVRAVTTNKGALAQNNVPVTLNLTGANTFTNMQVVASLAACVGQATSTFASFTPTAFGTNSVTASVPADDAPANNSATNPLLVTGRSYSYQYPGTTSAGGVGFNTATGAFVAKFPTTAANAVLDVKLEFPGPIPAPSPTYRVAIYGDSGGTPSTTPLYVDAADRTPPVGGGPVTITLPAPLAVAAGNFYVGIHQTLATNAGLGFDDEQPLRSGAFFLAAPLPVTAWADEQTQAGAGFKLNVGVTLRNGVPAPLTAVSRKMHAGVPFDIDLLAANPIECRSGGAGNDYQIVLSGFPNPVTFVPGDVSVSPGTGTVMSSSGSGTTTVTINLTGVTNAQKITVKIANLTDNAVPANTGTLGVTMGVLIGDTNNNGVVNAGDTSQTKGRSGQVTDGTNFRSDVNTDGVINAGDSSAVKSRSGTALP